MSDGAEQAVLRDLVALCDKHGRAAVAKGMLTMIHRWCRQGVAMADAAAEGRTPEEERPVAKGRPRADDPKPVGQAIGKAMSGRR